jgi:hypothetical protein
MATRGLDAALKAAEAPTGDRREGVRAELAAKLAADRYRCFKHADLAQRAAMLDPTTIRTSCDDWRRSVRIRNSGVACWSLRAAALGRGQAGRPAVDPQVQCRRTEGADQRSTTRAKPTGPRTFKR